MAAGSGYHVPRARPGGIARNATIPALAWATVLLILVSTYLALPPLALFFGGVIIPAYVLSGGARRVFKGRRGARWGREATRSVAHPGEAATAPVGLVDDRVETSIAARVVEAWGMCPAGYQLRVTQEFVFDSSQVSPELCPRARKAILPYATGIHRGGQDPGVLWVCQGPDHRVVFRLQRAKVGGAPLPKSA